MSVSYTSRHVWIEPLRAFIRDDVGPQFVGVAIGLNPPKGPERLNAKVCLYGSPLHLRP